MRLRTIALSMVLLMSALCFSSSCQKKAQKRGSTASTMQTKEWSLKEAARSDSGITIHMIGEDYPPLQAIGKIKGNFEKETGIKVEVEGYEAEAVIQKITFDINSKTGHYDLIVQVYFDMGRLVTQGQLRSLDDFIKDPKLRDPDFNAESDLFPVSHSMGWYDGRMYGYPMMVLTMYTWYRKDLMDNPKEKEAFKAKYGYDLQVPQNWNQYRDIAEFFTRPEQGLYGTLIQGKKHMALWQEYINFLYSFGGAILETNDPSKYGPIVINSPEAIEATKFYKSLLKYSPSDALNFTWDDAIALWQQGKVFMSLMWTDQTYIIEDPNQSKVAGKVGFALIPKGQAGSVHQIGGQSYYIPVTSKNPEAAFLFLQWMMGKDNQIRQQKLGGASARKSTYDDSEILKLPWTQASIAALEHTHPAMLYTIPESLQIGDVIQRAISEALAGTRSVEDALNWAAEEIQRLLKGKAQMKYPVPR